MTMYTSKYLDSLVDRINEAPNNIGSILKGIPIAECNVVRCSVFPYNGSFSDINQFIYKCIMCDNIGTITSMVSITESAMQYYHRNQYMDRMRGYTPLCFDMYPQVIRMCLIHGKYNSLMYFINNADRYKMQSNTLTGKEVSHLLRFILTSNTIVDHPEFPRMYMYNYLLNYVFNSHINDINIVGDIEQLTLRYSQYIDKLNVLKSSESSLIDEINRLRNSDNSNDLASMYGGKLMDIRNSISIISDNIKAISTKLTYVIGT